MTEERTKNSLKIIDKVVAEGRKKSSKKPTALFEKFTKQFLLDTSYDFLAESKLSDLYAISLGNWEFVNQRKKSIDRKVRVFNPNKKDHGWETERTVVELCKPDSPFILDSITADLTERGFKIYDVIHPVMGVKRDKSGKITGIYDNGDKTVDHESIMHFQISHIADGEDLKFLEEEIDNTLHFVNLCVDDWRPMCKKTEEIMVSLGYKDELPFGHKQIEEVKDFLKWSLDNNFIFLGYCQYDFVDNKGNPKISIVKNSELGIFKSGPHEAKPLGLAALPTKNIGAIKEATLLEITKASRKSIVHRPVHMDYIGIKRFDKKGKIIGEHRLLGLFTSSVYYQSALLIPIIRKKIEAVVRRSEFKPDSHNGKALVTVLETYPRDELLQITEDDLFNISMGIVELSERPSTKLFVRKDRFLRFVSCVIFVPRDRFNTSLREKIQGVLERSYNGIVTDYYTQVTEVPLARIHLLIKVDEDSILNPDIKQIERDLVEITSSWSNGLHDTIVKELGEREGEKLYQKYVNAFPESFKDLYHFGGTFRDIMKMQEAYKKKSLALDLDLYQLQHDDEDSYQLKLYNPVTQVTLSNILPILENMGFHAVDEHTFLVKPSHKKKNMWIHHFRLKVGRSVKIESPRSKTILSTIKREFEEALFQVWHKDIEDDGLNKLILRANMKWRDVILLRAYSKYILQTDIHYSHEFMASAIARHPVLTKLLIDLFHARFEPGPAGKKRETRVKGLVSSINKALAKVENVAEDKVIRQFFETIMATLRTNYFQKDKKGNSKTYISFKLDSKKVPNIPLPRPYREIFVYSRETEGIHLRGGKVARGGLRWSDRVEDFRTEVLGLVKAQMTKNSVIVPVGSKGGFVVKYPIEGTRDEMMAQGIESYRTFLSGLLDVTDNIVDGKIIPPKDVVRHDEEDPYLVVAADKGTATFSDIANELARSYGFWLDDAFASGGSVGYDHKKMGITARGAWVSVQRHFMEMGIDVQKEDFTVIGVGGMFGDVFGNGMLLSKHIRLLASWGSSNIFIDPNPDSAISYKERKRLFNMPRSSWEDYDEKLISKGGGVFDRKAKLIPISKEMKEVFGIKEKYLSPEDLIKKLLLADVDLFWNGGIGTYVKAEGESHESVGDKANDNVRVNGKEMGSKVVGEGGNLGLTQLGRIEFAAHGGRVNTDAIDNSAGVDCSDHEVNIKIALNKAVKKGKISVEERNKVLASMTDDVAHLVLRDNTLQTLAITIAELQGPMVLEPKSRLMKYLEDKDLLDRKIEFLPDDETIAARQADGKGLTRPELSVILAYSKLDLYDDLISSHLPDDEYFAGDLVLYFPEAMRERFKDEIMSHELRREIIATSVCNSMVNRVGSTFYHRIKEDTGMKGCDVARAYTVSRDAFGLRKLWADIEKLGSRISVEVQNELYIDIRRLVERTTSWLLRNSTHPLNASKIVSEFAPGVEELTACLDEIIAPDLKKACDKKLADYVSKNVPKPLAQKIANLEALSSACDIVHVAKGGKLPIRTVGEIYYQIGTRLKLGWLRHSAHRLLSHSHWDNLSVQTMKETLFDQQMELTAEVMRTKCKGNSCKAALDAWFEVNEKSLERYDMFIDDLRKQDIIDHSMLTVAIQRAEALF